MNAYTIERAGVLAAALLAGSSLTASEVALRWKFKEGQTIYQTMAMRMSMDGGAMKSQSEMTLDSKWDVRKVEPDGTAEIAQKIERVRQVMTIPGKPSMTYDSAAAKDPEGPLGTMLAPLFKRLMASAITLRMTARGEVTEVKVPREIQDALGGLPGAGGLEGLLSEEAVKQTWNAMTLPAEPLATGKSWTSKVKMSQRPLGVIHLHNVQTYRGVEKQEGRELHRIDIQGSMGFEKGADSQIDVKFKDFDVAGKIYFDQEAGRWAAIDQVQKMTMLLSMATKAAVPVQEVSMTMAQKIQFADAAPPARPAAPGKEKEAR